MTAGVFAHLSLFPALSLFNVEDCNLGLKQRQAARKQGWNYRTGKDLSNLLVKGCATGNGWDSIVHASFRLGGAFNERSTLKGVEAIDTIPVLHMSIGATQPDALVGVIGERGLRSFYRDLDDTFSCSNKRPSSQDVVPNIKMSHNKPTLRASKQRKMADFLTGFAG